MSEIVKIEKFGPYDRAVSTREAAVLTSLSVPEIHKRVATGGDFPRSFAIGPKRRAFMLSDIMLWLATKATSKAA